MREYGVGVSVEKTRKEITTIEIIIIYDAARTAESVFSGRRTTVVGGTVITTTIIIIIFPAADYIL